MPRKPIQCIPEADSPCPHVENHLHSGGECGWWCIVVMFVGDDVVNVVGGALWG